MIDLSASGSGPAPSTAADGAMRPTSQQGLFIDAFRAGKNIIGQARAGTGKTATLVMAARQQPHTKTLYAAYNKGIADDARRKFGGNVDCRTLHSLAFARTKGWMKDRLALPRQNGRMVAQILGITAPLVVGAGHFGMPVDVRLTPNQLGRITLETVRHFCYSGDDELQWWHVPRQHGFTEEAHRKMADYMLTWARRAWEDITYPQGLLRYDHDFYLKLWAMTDPQLPYGIVMLDEAQDSNRLTSRLIARQHDCQTVLVGDPCQQLYAWRGAIDAMAEFPNHEIIYLTQSFRFGEPIAEIGNVFLRLCGAEPLVRGNPQLPSRVVRDMIAPDAILCRTNAGAMEQVIQQFTYGRAVYLQGGGEAIRRMAEAAIELRLGRGTNNPELCAFANWYEVVDYAEQDPGGQDLRAFVRLIDQHGAEAIIEACDKLTNAPTSQGFDDGPGSEYGRAPQMNEVPLGTCVVSTIHRSKGLEWRKVQIADDVASPRVDAETWGIETDPDPAEMMLNYVAATRAQLELEPGPLRAWRDLEIFGQ